jgi:hypothetical protein
MMQPTLKTTTFKKSVIVSIIWIFIMLVMVGCDGGGNGGNENGIVGTWVAGDTTWVFTPEGIYSETVEGKDWDSGTYTTSGGQLFLTHYWGLKTPGINYQVSGDTLTGLVDAHGNDVPLSRSEGNPDADNAVGTGGIIGTWVAGDTTLTFNADGTYKETLQGMTFDIGTYTINGGQFTMTSRGGNTGRGTYQISGNKLTGFADGYGSLVTYTRVN